MIDKADIFIRYPFREPQLSGVPGRHSLSPHAKHQKIAVVGTGWVGAAQATITSEGVRLVICPQKVLGELNVYGSSNFQRVVRKVAPLVLKRLNLHIPALVNSIRRGDYQVKAVDVAYHFPTRDCAVGDFVERMYRRMNRAYPSEWMHRGKGFVIRPRSRHVKYVIYDKENQIKNMLKKFSAKGRELGYMKRLAEIHDRTSIASVGLVARVAEHHRIAELGPRLEIRFGGQYFRKSELKLGSNWKPNTADMLYEKHLKKLAFPAKISPTLGRVRAKNSLKPSTFQTYLLWANGENLQEVEMSRNTRDRHRAAIRNALNVDIFKPASATFGKRRTIDCLKVFDWTNRIEAFSD